MGAFILVGLFFLVLLVVAVRQSGVRLTPKVLWESFENEVTALDEQALRKSRGGPHAKNWACTCDLPASGQHHQWHHCPHKDDWYDHERSLQLSRQWDN